MMRNTKSIYILLLLALITTILELAAQGNGDNAKKKVSNKIVSISPKSYAQETAKGVVLVDYWATWCGPCRKMEPILKTISEETEVKVLKLNVDNYKPFVLGQQINTVPTMIIYKDGKEVERLSGVYQKEELFTILKKYL